jgi:glycosyltransferase involved in cell wall biosynthesis
MSGQSEMRVLVIHSALSGWGAEKNLRAISANAAARRVTYLLTVETPGTEYEEDVVFLEAPQIRPNRFVRWVNFFIKAVYLFGWLKENAWQFDLILVTSSEEALLVFYSKRILSLSCKLVVFNQTHWSEEMKHSGISGRVLGYFYVLICRDADAVFCLSEGSAHDLASVHQVGCPIFVHPGCIPSNQIYNGLSTIEQVGRIKTVLYVGRISNRQKRVDIFVNALAKLRGQVEFRAVIVGSGEDEAAILKLIHSQHLEDVVSIAGATSDPFPYYRSADVFVLCSDYEGFGNVLVEAMACGLPVVATDCPSGPAEVLAAGKYGVLVPRGDSAAIAGALSKILTDQELALELREKSIRRARNYECSEVFRRFWRNIELLTQS